MKKIYEYFLRKDAGILRDSLVPGMSLSLAALFLFAALLITTSVSNGAEKTNTGDPSQFAAAAPGFDGKKVIPGQYIVQFKEDVSEGEIEDLSTDIISAYSGKKLFTYKKAIKGFAAVLSASAAEALRSNPLVKSVEADGEVRISTTQNSATWGLDRIDQANLPLSTTYTYNSTGQGVNVYIIDTGIRTTHTEFGGRATADFTAITSDGCGLQGCHWHGTHVAGTVGGATYGVAKNVALHSVRVLDANGSGSISGVIAGIDYVTANKVLPAVANMSLSGGMSAALNDAVTNSINSGVVYVVAAGNSASDGCSYSPSSAAAAITVGATDNTDTQASFSNWGSCLDLYAPGVSILSALNTGDNATGFANGTSMASPHVAGVAALYLAENPSATPAQVADAITTGGTKNKLTGLRLESPNILVFSLLGVTPPPGDTTAPSVPANLTGSSPDSVAISLSWSASTDNVGVVGYKVYKNSVFLTTVTGTTYVDPAVLAGATYSYYVQAYDAAGNVSGSSNGVSVTIPSGGQALEITGYSASAISATTATISWATNLSSTGFVTYSKGAVVKGTVQDNTAATSHSVTLTGLMKNTSYSYTITAANGNATVRVTGTFRTSRR